MSYYNFNDHFWSPKTVCVQKSVVNSQESNTNSNKLKIFFSILFIAICTPLLFGISSRMAEQKLKNASMNVNDSNCLIVTRNQGMQLYCSNK